MKITNSSQEGFWDLDIDEQTEIFYKENPRWHDVDAWMEETKKKIVEFYVCTPNKEFHRLEEAWVEENIRKPILEFGDKGWIDEEDEQWKWIQLMDEVKKAIKERPIVMHVFNEIAEETEKEKNEHPRSV